MRSARRDYAGTRFSPLTKINTGNVKKLVPVWSFSFGTLDAQNTTPLVLDGVMYVTAAHAKIFAVVRKKKGVANPLEPSTA